MSDRRPRSSLVVDVLAYALARLLLVVVLTAAIFGAAHLLGVRDFPLVVAMLFALVIALPLGIWIFTRCGVAPPRASPFSTNADARTASSCRRGCAATRPPPATSRQRSDRCSTTEDTAEPVVR